VKCQFCFDLLWTLLSQSVVGYHLSRHPILCHTWSSLQCLEEKGSCTCKPMPRGTHQSSQARKIVSGCLCFLLLGADNIAASQNIIGSLFYVLVDSIKIKGWWVNKFVFMQRCFISVIPTSRCRRKKAAREKTNISSTGTEITKGKWNDIPSGRCTVWRQMKSVSNTCVVVSPKQRCHISYR